MSAQTAGTEAAGWEAGDDAPDEPYGTALTDGGALLRLIDVAGRVAPVDCDVRQWLAEPTPSDRSVLTLLDGQVLDVGCGPGRMLRAAREQPLSAAGVDLNPRAVSLARSAGSTVYRQSVFDPMPRPWHGFLLLDGNIGIGGNPMALLRRLRELADRSARLLVETDPDPDLEEHYRAVLCDRSGRCGEAFDWSRVGSRPLRRFARATGWLLDHERRRDGRSFSLLRTR